MVRGTRIFASVFAFFVVSLAFLGTVFTPKTAVAQQIACSGLPATTDAILNIAVVFNPDTRVCTVSVLGSGQILAAGSNAANVITFSSDADELLGFVGDGTSASAAALETCDMPGTSASTASCQAFPSGGNPFSGTVTLGNVNSVTGELNQVRFTATADGTGSATVTAAFASLTEIDAAPVAGTPSSAAPVLTATVAKTQTRFTTQNIQRHVDLLTGGGVVGAGAGAGAGDGAGVPEPTPGGPSGSENFGEPEQPASAAPRVAVSRDDPFSERLLSAFLREDEKAPRRNMVGANTTREAARFLLPKLNFDSAKGDTLDTFLGADRRLNQTENQSDRPEPGPPQRLERADTDTNVWLYGGYSSLTNERNLPGDDQRFDGDILTVSGGIDHWFRTDLLAGVSAGYSSVALDTDFNDGRYDEDGYTLAPYFVYTPFDWLVLNASAGYTYSRIDQSQNRSTTVAESNPNAHTLYLSVGAKGTYRLDKITVAGSVGYVRSRRRVDSFTDSQGAFTEFVTSNTSLVRTGAEAAYALTLNPNNLLTPFVTAQGTFEFQDLTNNDPVAAEVGGGATWTSRSLGMTASLEATSLVGRDDYEQWNLRGNVVKGMALQDIVGTFTPRLSFGMSAAQVEAGLGLGYSDDIGRLDMSLILDGLRARDPDAGAGMDGRVQGTLRYRY